MNKRLKEIMKSELTMLETLLNLLDKQYNLLVSQEKDVVEVSKVAEEIDSKLRDIVDLEVEKKRILNNDSLSKIVEMESDDDIKLVYNRTLQVLDVISMQKNTNDMFIKQQLFFTKSMIRAITPTKNAEIYDSFGKIRK